MSIIKNIFYFLRIVQGIFQKAFVSLRTTNKVFNVFKWFRIQYSAKRKSSFKKNMLPRTPLSIIFVFLFDCGQRGKEKGSSFDAPLKTGTSGMAGKTSTNKLFQRRVACGQLQNKANLYIIASLQALNSNSFGMNLLITILTARSLGNSNVLEISSATTLVSSKYRIVR